MLCMGIFFACMSNFDAQAQFFDSIKVQFTHKPSLDVRLESRNSFITSSFAKISAVKVGLDYNRRVQVGLSSNWLFSDITRPTTIDVEGIPTSTNVRLQYQYVAPYFEYTFYRKSGWEFNIPVMIGIGRSHYFTDIGGQRYKTDASWVVSYEPFMVGQYHLLRYFAVGLGVGYRLILVGHAGLNESFNSPVYILKGRVILGQIWTDIKKVAKK